MTRVSAVLAVLAVLLFAACGHESGSGSGTGTSVPPPPLPPATCEVPGLAGVPRIQALRLPTGCRFSSVGTMAAPYVVVDAADLALKIECTGATPPAIDLAANDLLIVTHSLSPAYGGGETVDDGTTVTFVTQFRPNCPNDPMPMPMNVSYGFLLPKGAARVFREANCSLPSRC